MRSQLGPEVAVSEAYRYLAELPWVPYAIMVNRELDWQEVNERHVEVTTRSVMSARP